jgi:hypothetical protein
MPNFKFHCKLKRGYFGVLLFIIPLAVNAQMFYEDFGNLANGTVITTSNTSLTYVRIGTGGGSITAVNPSFFSGAALQIVGPSSTSLNGIGVASGLEIGDVFQFSLDFRLQNTTGQAVMGVGTGPSFTGNTTFSGAHGLFWLQISAGQLQHRTAGGSWANVSDPLSTGTNYSLSVVVNRSNESVNYGESTLTAGRMDIILNNSVVATGVALTTPTVTPDAFRIYSVTGANITLDNITLTPIPEPSTYAMILGLVALVGVATRRRYQVRA